MCVLFCLNGCFIDSVGRNEKQRQIYFTLQRPLHQCPYYRFLLDIHNVKHVVMPFWPHCLRPSARASSSRTLYAYPTASDINPPPAPISRPSHSPNHALRNPNLQPKRRKPHLPRLPQRLPPPPRRRLPHSSHLQRPSPLPHPHSRLHDLQPCQA